MTLVAPFRALVCLKSIMFTALYKASKDRMFNHSNMISVQLTNNHVYEHLNTVLDPVLITVMIMTNPFYELLLSEDKKSSIFRLKG